MPNEDVGQKKLFDVISVYVTLHAILTSTGLGSMRKVVGRGVIATVVSLGVDVISRGGGCGKHGGGAVVLAMEA